MEANPTRTSATSLEQFVADYLDAVGGVWEEIESEVFDVLLPADANGQGVAENSLRVTFDPEALPEHPGAQLANFGSPFVDGLLENAIARGQAAHAYVVGLNLAPYDLSSRVTRAIKIGSGLEWKVMQVRAKSFSQAVFWFRAMFVSDQKEMELLPSGFDLYYGRQVRHLQHLVDDSNLADQPAQVLPEARRRSLGEVFLLARERVQRTLSSLGNLRSRELNERLDKQVVRMAGYYSDLREEAAEQAARAQKKEQSTDKFTARRDALIQEEQIRIAELRHKHALRVQLQLLNVLVVHQPKLLIDTEVAAPNKSPAPWQLVWDPLTESLEAPESDEHYELLQRNFGGDTAQSELPIRINGAQSKGCFPSRIWRSFVVRRAMAAGTPRSSCR